MDVIGVNRYVVIIPLLCHFLFVGFSVLTVSRYSLPQKVTLNFLILVAAFVIYLSSINPRAVYSNTLSMGLLVYAATDFFSSIDEISGTQPTDQPNMPNPDQESAGEGAPEKKLTMFAITMSILNLTASGLAFLKCSLGVWKTQGVMVKLITVLTSILKVIQIISHSCGVELHHMHNMQQLSHSTDHSLSCIFYWFHLISVLASGAFSVVRLAKHDFGENKEALVFFYVVAFLEALVFLGEKAFWQWKVIWYNKLVENAKDECGFETSEIVKRFLYDAYYKCMTGNIFDVPKMNLVTFAEELLVSTSDEEQFMGTRILLKLLNHQSLSNATLGKILTSKDSKVIARLIQMLNLNNFFKENIRSSAAEIVIMFLKDKEPKMQHMAGMREAIKSAESLRPDLTRTERSAHSGRTDRGESRSNGNVVVNEDLHDSANDHFTWKKYLSPRSLYLLLTSCYAELNHRLTYSVVDSLLVGLCAVQGVKSDVFSGLWQMNYLVLFTGLYVNFRLAMHLRSMRQKFMMMEIFPTSVIFMVLSLCQLVSEKYDGETEKAAHNNPILVMAVTNFLLIFALPAFLIYLNSVAKDDADIVRTRSTNESSISIYIHDSTGKGASEKNLIMFVITIGILDLMASGLGLLKYSLVPWKSLEAIGKFITVLTFIFEGIRICCRSRGFELHHMHNIKQLPFFICFISWLFYCLHFIVVLASGILSIVGLGKLIFGETEEALVFFYVMAFLEALVFFAKVVFWERKLSFLAKKVKSEYKLDTTDMGSIRRFVYNAYYKCVTGYIFDVYKMDLFTFAEELLFSTSGEEQLMGIRIMMKLSTHPDFSDDTLRKIGTSTVVISRLIQMLCFENYFEEKIRTSAAQIVSKLAVKKPNLKDHVVGMEQAIELANALQPRRRRRRQRRRQQHTTIENTFTLAPLPSGALPPRL